MTAPDVLVLGGMKCGTTSLYAHLRDSIPCRLLPKEAAVLLHGSRGATPTTIGTAGPLIDVSTTYCMLDQSPTAAADALRRAGPNLQLVFVVRDPFERTVSHHRHEARSGRVPIELRRAISEAPRLREYSCYGAQLERWRDAFGDHRIHLVDFHSMADNPEDEIGRLASFLDVPARRVGARHENDGRGRLAVHHRLLPFVQSPVYRSLRRHVPRVVEDRARQLLLKDRSDRARPVEEDRAWLRDDAETCELFRADAERYADLLGSRTPDWIERMTS